MYDNTNSSIEAPHPCVPTTDESFKETMQETKNILAELLVVMGDTTMQLFSDSPIEKAGTLEGKCFADDVRIINNQAKMAMNIMVNMRRKILG